MSADGQVDLVRRVAALFELGRVSRVVELGLSFNTVLRFSTSSGKWVARISPRGWVDPSYEHELRRYLTQRSSLVSAPVRSPDGDSCFHLDGRWVSVYPFVDGDTFGFESPWVAVDEARVLAELHALADAFPRSGLRPGYPPLCARDWKQRSHASAEERLRTLVRGPEAADANLRTLAEMAERLLEAFSFVRRWTAAAASGEFGPLRLAPIHGDYGPHNLVVHDGAIAAVIDWDDCRPEWLGWEVARAAWHFEGAGAVAGGVAETAFVRDYLEAGGPLEPHDVPSLDPLLKCVLVQRSIGSILSDPVTDHVLERVRAQLELFEALPSS